MNVLSSREYNPRKAKADRVRFLPHGLLHPAKMTPALALDLVRRYTRPGQMICDPCFGVGTTLLAMLLGRKVLGIELEEHHFRDAQLNAAHIARMAQDMTGSPSVYHLENGDSREVLRGLAFDSSVMSPAFGEMNGPHRGGNVTQRPNKDGQGFEGGKEYFTYTGHPQATITSPAYGTQMPDQGDPARAIERIKEKVARGELKHPEGNPGGVGARTAWGGGQVRSYTHGYGLDASLLSPDYQTRQADDSPGVQKNREDLRRGGERLYGRKYTGASYTGATEYGVDASLTSPAYEKVASRNRHLEPSAQKDPERAAKYGDADPSRHVSGYGKNTAQIGNMKLKDNSYQEAMTTIYERLLEATVPGGVLVLVTGNYIEKGQVIDLAQVTIDLCRNAGWTPYERWAAVKRSSKGTPAVSFWRLAQAKNGLPMIDYEDVLCFVKGDSPAWEFSPLDNGRWPNG